MLQVTSLEIKSAVPPALLDRGCVNVIGFDAIRSRAGARWPKLRDSVVVRLEALLRHTLRPTDFFAPLNDTAYLVTMPAADPQDVTVVCLRIAYDLHNNLIGRCDLGHIQVSVAREAGDELALQPVARDVVLALAEKAGIHDLAPGPDQAISLCRTTAGSRTISEGPLQTVHNYMPIWDSRNEAVTTYLCRTKAYRTSGKQAEAIQLEQMDGKDRAMVELSGLHKAVADLESALKSGRRVLLAVPFTFDMIGSPLGRMELASACRHLLAEHRQYLVFVLTNVPRGVAQSRLADIVNTLRPFARCVMATVAPDSRWHAAYQGIGLHGIGMRAQECIGKPGRLESDIARLSTAARSAQLGVFLFGITSPDVLDMARNMGVRWLSGPALRPAVQRPVAMCRLQWDEIARPTSRALATA